MIKYNQIKERKIGILDLDGILYNMLQEGVEPTSIMDSLSRQLQLLGREDEAWNIQKMSMRV